MMLGHTSISISISLALFVALAGCGAKGLPTVPVSGKITFNGGPCPAEGSIAFSPVSVQEGLPRRPGTAKFKRDGAFRVTSFEEGDGLLPGTYRAIVSCWNEGPADSDRKSADLNFVPANYTPQEIVVASTADEVEVTIDVPSKH